MNCSSTVPMDGPILGSAPAGSLHGLQPPPGHVHCCATATRRDLHTVPIGCRGTACLSMGLSWAAENNCSAPGVTPALLSTALGACRAVSLTFLTPLPAAAEQQLFPFLDLLSQRHSQCHSWLSSAQWQVPFGTIWSWL